MTVYRGMQVDFFRDPAICFEMLELHLLPAVDRQPWSPREKTRREAPAASPLVGVLLFKPELPTELPELMKMTSKITFFGPKMTQNQSSLFSRAFLAISGGSAID